MPGRFISIRFVSLFGEADETGGVGGQGAAGHERSDASGFGAIRRGRSIRPCGGYGRRGRGGVGPGFAGVRGVVIRCRFGVGQGAGQFPDRVSVSPSLPGVLYFQGQVPAGAGGAGCVGGYVLGVVAEADGIG